jgi:hypothetical protein
VAVAAVAIRLRVQAVRAVAVLAEYQTITAQQVQQIWVAVAAVALEMMLAVLMLAVLAVKVLSLFAHLILNYPQSQSVLLQHNQAVITFTHSTTAAQSSGVTNGLFCKTRRQHSCPSH